MKPNLLLLSPVTWYNSVKLPGLGLLCVGAMVRDEVNLMHMDANAEGYNLENFVHQIQDRPDIVAIQAQNTNRIFNVLHMSETLKRNFPDVTIITGGTHGTLDAEFLVKTKLIDYVVVGEGELSFQELVWRLIGKIDKPFEEIQGICLLGPDGEPMRTPARPFIQNLDDLPVPCWDVVDTSKYYMENSPFGTMTMIETSRGCAFGCTFCSPALLWKRTWRKKSPERVALEFRLAEERGAEFTWLAELDPCHDPDHIRGFCSELVKQGNTIRWFSQQRADQITAHPDLAPLMYAAGCRVANVGYESMSVRTLRSFNKGTTPAMNRKARNILREVGIITNGGLIIGVPGETKEEMMATIKFGLTLDFPDFAILRPYPSTRWSDESGGNEENRDNYKKFNEGWCFLHDNPKLVEFLHKYATFMAWFHPKRMFAFFSPDDFRRGFARWRYQVYAEVVAKRIWDKAKFRIQTMLHRLPVFNFKKPEQIVEGMEEYRFLPAGAESAMDNPAAMASQDLFDKLSKQAANEACDCGSEDGKGNGKGNGEDQGDGTRPTRDSQAPPQAASDDDSPRPSAS
jgi:radical SAM superfamily enzyme YgiQ (UPF0313 family)